MPKQEYNMRICLQVLAEKALLHDEDAGDQDLFTRVERTRRWRGADVHIVKALSQCVKGHCKGVHGTSSG